MAKEINENNPAKRYFKGTGKIRISGNWFNFGGLPGKIVCSSDPGIHEIMVRANYEELGEFECKKSGLEVVKL